MKLIDCAAVAAMLDLNEAHVRDRITKRKDFPAAYRLGRVLRWNAEEVADWLETRRVSPAVRRSRQRKLGNRPAANSDPGAQSSALGRECLDALPVA